MASVLGRRSAHAARLRSLHSPKGRAASGSFLVEGRKLIEHFLQRGVPLRSLVLGEQQHAAISAACSSVPRESVPPFQPDTSSPAAPPSLTSSLAAAPAAVCDLWSSALPYALTAAPATIDAVSQSSSPSGFLAEFRALPNYAASTADTAGALRAATRAVYAPVPSSVTGTGANTGTNAGAASTTRWSWSRGGLILAGTADPGNVGTLVRTAVSFGLRQVLLVGQCADVLGHKAVQASAGAITDALVVTVEGQGLEQLLDEAAAGPVGGSSRTHAGGAGEGCQSDEDAIPTSAQSPSRPHATHNHSTATAEAANADSVAAEDPMAAWAAAEAAYAATAAAAAVCDGAPDVTIDEILERGPILVALAPGAGVPLSKARAAAAVAVSVATPATASHGDGASSAAATELAARTDWSPWVVVGSEAHGIPPWLLSRAHVQARIPMAAEYGGKAAGEAGMDSLNAAVAGAIACYVVSGAGEVE